MGRAEDVRRLRHEVYAAEDNVLSLGLGRRLLGQLQGVAPEVGELDDFVPLVVVSQHDYTAAQDVPGIPDASLKLLAAEVVVLRRDALPAHDGGELLGQGLHRQRLINATERGLLSFR